MEDVAKSVGGEEIAPRTSLRDVLGASLIGTTVEYYDFFLYGTAAALVFNQLFFPVVDPIIGTLAAFGTFAVGFVARPVGGMLFGHFGDRIGRKTMLILALLIMGIPTAFIGLLPTYESIGIWAPVLLVVLRICQGIGLGGEWGGAVLLSVEYAPEGKRGFYGSWPQVGAPAGLLLSTAVFTVFSQLPDEQFLAWGWRVPFLISIVLVVVGLYVRLRIAETPAFARVKETGTVERMPLVESVRRYPKNILLCIGMRAAENGGFYIVTVFVLAYASAQLSIPTTTLLAGVVLGGLLEVFTLPLFGALSDRVGRRRVYMLGAAFWILFGFPLFWIVSTGVTVLIWLAIALAVGVGHSLMYGPQAAWFAELFGTRVRYSGASLGFQLGAVLNGGFAPLIASSLLLWGNNSPVYVAIYLMVLGGVSVLSVYLAAETFRGEISEQGEEEVVATRQA